MLGYITAEGRGAGDVLLADIADTLRAQGLSLAGAVQVNRDTDPALKCDMDLHILSGKDVIRISQNLGTLSSGCRLDPAGLEQAVGLVTAALDHAPSLLIVNKYGKQEIDGRGFRPVIGEALMRDIPVLLSVNAGNEAAFLDFAGELAQRVPATRDGILSWVSTQAMAA
ncbi:DUF2478 domain-containing protein [Sagittula sp. NFXS13]|uniref:DUF2478 domain-containing protein n=1 Tax=Sagittula sp. NFXS13 TaxID=2819095 RepID=UPI0032DF20FE